MREKIFACCFEYASEMAGLIYAKYAMNGSPSTIPTKSSVKYMLWLLPCKQLLTFSGSRACIFSIDVRFDKYGKIVLAMAGLVPSVISEDVCY